ncbi:MAG: chemoreceptor glutamine deamidase CheD [Betaproteobacteria bacterium]|nr:chemoreceptor glutamine deamidase CheD [Betaproteobacteria bacterium]
MHNDELQPQAPNLYFDPRFGMQAAKILPGEYYVSAREVVMVTVLGSCVSACIRDRRRGIGGMNHFMLPERGGGELIGAAARYGAYAMEILLNQLLKLGAAREDLEAKVFGGGSVLSNMTSINVGERNAEFVLKFLATEKIEIAARDLLDVWPRKIYYFPQTGRVLVKKLRDMHNDTIIARERDYGLRLEREPVAGDVELFG